MLEGLLGTLPEEQAAVIRAHYYQRQTVTEIGEQLGVKPHHVRHAEYMGLRAMRRHQRKLGRIESKSFPRTPYTAQAFSVGRSAAVCRNASQFYWRLKPDKT